MGLYIFGLVLCLPVVLFLRLAPEIANGTALLPLIDILKDKLFITFQPANLIYYGNTVMDHLWFLPALVFSTLFLYIAVRSDRTRELLIVASGLYIIGLTGQTYPVVSIPIPTRDAIFFGSFYTTVGYTIQRTGFRPEKHRRWLYLAAVPIFGVLHVAEWYIRGYIMGSHDLTSSVYVTNYSLLTAAWAISVFLLVLAYPNWGRHQRLSDLGNYAAGIYIIHLPILRLLTELSEQLQPLAGVAIHKQLVWEFLIAPFVFLMSLLFYRVIQSLYSAELSDF